MLSNLTPLSQYLTTTYLERVRGSTGGDGDLVKMHDELLDHSEKVSLRGTYRLYLGKTHVWRTLFFGPTCFPFAGTECPSAVVSWTPTNNMMLFTSIALGPSSAGTWKFSNL